MLTAEQAEIFRFAKNGQMDPPLTHQCYRATRDDTRYALCPSPDGGKVSL